MLQRCKNLGVAIRIGLAVCSLLLAVAPTASPAQEESWGNESRVSTEAERGPAETVITADLRVPRLETSSILAAVLCFAVGFAVCLLLVHSMLPSLVHAQCTEIVREYLHHSRREPDIRVVVLDRESHEPLQKPRRASSPAGETIVQSSYGSQHQRRVDRPAAPAAATPIGSRNRDGDDAPDSMLSQIYEQNLHLRDQLRKQSRSSKQ